MGTRWHSRLAQAALGRDWLAAAAELTAASIFSRRAARKALAALDAWVTRVETTSRGGNVVWMQPLFGEMRLYYAHERVIALIGRVV